MNQGTSASDPAEPDLYWSGHSGWATIPGTLVGVVVSAILMFGSRYLSEWTFLHDEWTAFATFWVILFGWLIMGAIWGYRSASHVYRLTASRLFLDFGSFSRPTAPIPLEDIRDVRSAAGWLERWFGVGKVELELRNGETIRLGGIFRPDRFAAAIHAARGAGLENPADGPAT